MIYLLKFGFMSEGKLTTPLRLKIYKNVEIDINWKEYNISQNLWDLLL